MREQDHESAQASALSFVFKVPEDLIAAVGLPKVANRQQSRAQASMLAALAVASDRDNVWTSYSRSRDFYAAAGRYEGTDYTYASVLGAVKTLGDMGLIEERRSKPGSHLSHGLQSRIRPSDRLIDLIGEAPVTYLGRRSPIVMKDENGTLADFRDTAQTRRLVTEVAEVNAYLANVQVEVSPDASDSDWRRTRHHLHARKVKDGRATWTCVRPTPNPEVYRVFGRGRWDRHGRWYGWFQNLPKERRAELLINGELCIEPDFAALHPTLLYAMRGHVLQHDPYVLRCYDRSVGKIVLNTAINARTIHKAIGSLMEKRQERKADGSPEWVYSYRETARIVEAVMDANPAIREDIGSDAGVRLMAIDAGMTHQVLKSSAKAGIAVLPVHDSVMAPASKEREVTAIMSDVLASTISGLSQGISMGSIQSIRYMGGRGRVEVSVGTVVTHKAEPVEASPAEPRGGCRTVEGAVVSVVAPFRPVVRPLPPRVAALRPAVAAAVPEAVVASLAPSVTPPCSVVAYASPGPSGGRVALPAFLAALLPAVASGPSPGGSPEPAAPPVPPLRLGTSLGGLRPSLPPADVAPEDLPPSRAPAAPVAAAPRPEPIVVSLAPAAPVVPAALPRPPEPKTREERISLLGSIIAQSRAKRSLQDLAHADARMAELKAMAKRERRVR